MRGTRGLFLVRTVAGLALAASAAGLVAQQAMQTGTGADWPGVGGSADESGYSQLSAINTANIRKLGLA